MSEKWRGFKKNKIDLEQKGIGKLPLEEETVIYLSLGQPKSLGEDGEESKTRSSWTHSLYEGGWDLLEVK